MVEKKSLSILVAIAALSLILGMGSSAVAQEDTSAWLPPNAVAGECYAKVFIPPSYKTVTKQVLLRQESERLEITPAQYGWVEEKVMISPAAARLEVIPAEFKWTEEKVLVKEASYRVEQTKAKYDWATEKLMVKPAEKIWKKGRGPIEKVDHGTGEIMCLVEIPATYKTVKKRVLVQGPTTRKIEIPAEYKTIKKKVLVSAADVRKIEIPAKYDTVKVRKMLTPPQEKRTAIPAQYQTVKQTEKVSEGHMEWRRILCETNTTGDFVTRVQRALLKAGHNPGPIDGVLGRETRTAVNSYQKSNGLAAGALTYETVKRLGVSF